MQQMICPTKSKSCVKTGCIPNKSIKQALHAQSQTQTEISTDTKSIDKSNNTNDSCNIKSQ